MRLKLALLTLGLLVMRVALAADPQPYTVRISPTGDPALDATLHASSQLVSLRTSAPVGAFALIGRAQQDIERLKTVLESYGYYRSTVSMIINDRSVDDPGLAEVLEALPKGQSAKVNVQIDKGPLFHLRHVMIDGTVSAGVLKQFKLVQGDPAVASEVLAARQRLLNALQEEGRAFAKVDEPVAYEAAEEPVLDVTFHVEPGEVYSIGAIRFEGLKRTHEAFLRKRVQAIHVGDHYSPGEIEKARVDLLSLGIFSSISIGLPKQSEVTVHELTVTFLMHERARHAVNFNAGYSTDLGGSAGVTWIERNVFGNAEQLSYTASVINAGGTATEGLGYNVGVQLSKPDFWVRDQTVQVGVVALKEDLIAYEQTSQTASVALNRKLSSVWGTSIGLSIEQEVILQDKITYGYTLFAVPLSARYDSTNLASPLDDPLHGLRATFSVTPTQSLGHSREYFVILQGSVSTYYDLTRLGWTAPGRSLLAARVLAGSDYGAGSSENPSPCALPPGWVKGDPIPTVPVKVPNIPPDQRFYGGGTGTVRGFRYQSIGPTFCDDNPIGGTQLGAVNAEYRQRFGRSWGMALFVDGGTVTDGDRPFEGAWSVGYGAGARFYTPIGPIRFDFALPVVKPEKGDGFEVYVGLGQAF